MSSKALHDSRTYTQSLEKLSSSNGSEAEILDVLNAMKTIPVTVDLLRETGMGKVVAGLKKKFGPETDVHKESRELVARWKKECEVGSAGPSTTEAKTSSKDSDAKESKIDTKTKETKDERTEADGFASGHEHEHDHDHDHNLEVEEAYNRLHPSRQKIITLISDQLKLSGASASLAKICALEIETNIDGLHSFQTENKAYISKARSLISNLKTNAKIRDDIIDGSLSAFLLVRLTSDELATEEVREARERDKKLGRDSRRSDYYENVAKDKIQRANGIDPTRGGEFICGKCKGNRTSHYAMQTRSADEPMTVFVRCLNCGNRWRTQ